MGSSSSWSNKRTNLEFASGFNGQGSIQSVDNKLKPLSPSGPSKTGASTASRATKFAGFHVVQTVEEKVTVANEIVFKRGGDPAQVVCIGTVDEAKEINHEDEVQFDGSNGTSYIAIEKVGRVRTINQKMKIQFGGN